VTAGHPDHAGFISEADEALLLGGSLSGGEGWSFRVYSVTLAGLLSFLVKGEPMGRDPLYGLLHQRRSIVVLL